MAIQGPEPHGPEHFHEQLGDILYEHCGVSRTVEGLEEGIRKIRALREDFWTNISIPGSPNDMNQTLEAALRLVDYINLGELMCIDALHRRESCGGHFRAESQTDDGEALRHDDQFAYVTAWEFGADGAPVLHKEDLNYKFIELKQRSYK